MRKIIQSVRYTLGALAIASGFFGVGYITGNEKGVQTERDKWKCIESPKITMGEYKLSELAREDIFKTIKEGYNSDDIMALMDRNNNKVIDPLEHHNWRIENHKLGK